jgi:hypothetical protein
MILNQLSRELMARRSHDARNRQLLMLRRTSGLTAATTRLSTGLVQGKMHPSFRETFELSTH